MYQRLTSQREGVSLCSMPIFTPAHVEYFTERHRLGLFADGEYMDAFRSAGLKVAHDRAGLLRRGLFLTPPCASSSGIS
jgi:hypothetical protein